MTPPSLRLGSRKVAPRAIEGLAAPPPLPMTSTLLASRACLSSAAAESGSTKRVAIGGSRPRAVAIIAKAAAVMQSVSSPVSSSAALMASSYMSSMCSSSITPGWSNAAKMATWAASGWMAPASWWDLRRWASPHECGGQPQAFRCSLMSPWWPAVAPPRQHFDHAVHARRVRRRAQQLRELVEGELAVAVLVEGLEELLEGLQGGDTPL